MPILTVVCPKCDKSLKVDSKLAGRSGKCPGCATAIEIPPVPAVGPRTPVPPTSESPDANNPPLPKPRGHNKTELSREVLSAFEGEIKRVNAPAMYRVGIVLATIAMVTLPLIYIALIGATIYAVYYHTVSNTGILSATSGRASTYLLLVYLAPIVVGAILIFFMIKPLFARSVDHQRSRSLTRGGEPLLFEFVDRLCQCVHAPKPKRINVDCDVNASASFQRGMLSMFGNDLVLTIGVPLVAGLSMRQFAGVLAHEFGHFSQGAGMRLTYIVRSINHWFTRVVYQRDEWDEWLSSAASELDTRISWILWLSQLFVWLTRGVLWVLMMIGHIVAGFMLRQMEFDADRHEARFAGSEVFESTARRLVTLNVAYNGAIEDLFAFFNTGKLADNLPRLIIVNVDQIPSEMMKEINNHIEKSGTGLLDTHPANRDRIASARRENAPGVFRLERQASNLFTDFDTLAKNVTWDFYRSFLGTYVKPTDMHPVSELLAQSNE